MLKELANPMVRARVERKRKRNAEAILAKMGVTPGQAINMLYAQIELKRGLPFAVAAENNSDVLAPIEQVASVWGKLDRCDYSYLAQR